MVLTRFRKAFSWRYRRFVQRQGHVVMTVLCAAVIAGSAAWTQQAGLRRSAPSAEPTPDAASAADLWQQSLQSAATPAPTAAPLWQIPVARAVVAMGYDPLRLAPSGIKSLWRVHDAVDFAAEPGDEVTAIRDGVVTGVTDTTVVITHDGGWVSEYEGLATTGDLREGQTVRGGDVIGIAGGSAHGRSDSVHLRVTLNGEPADPVALLELE